MCSSGVVVVVVAVVFFCSITDHGFEVLLLITDNGFEVFAVRDLIGIRGVDGRSSCVVIKARDGTDFARASLRRVDSSGLISSPRSTASPTTSETTTLSYSRRKPTLNIYLVVTK